MVFLNRQGEVIEPALFPQFRNPPKDLTGIEVNARATKSIYPSLLDKHSERDLLKILHFREKWGRQKPERVWNQVLGEFARRTPASGDGSR